MSQGTNIRVVNFSDGVAASNEQVGSELKKLADEIISGEWGEVEFITAVMDTDRGILRSTIGQPGSTTKRNVVAALTWAVHKIMSD